MLWQALLLNLFGMDAPFSPATSVNCPLSFDVALEKRKRFYILEDTLSIPLNYFLEVLPLS